MKELLASIQIINGIIALVIGAVIFALWWSQPHLTQMQLFKEYLGLYFLMVGFAVLSVVRLTTEEDSDNG